MGKYILGETTAHCLASDAPNVAVLLEYPACVVSIIHIVGRPLYTVGRKWKETPHGGEKRE